MKHISVWHMGEETFATFEDTLLDHGMPVLMDDDEDTSDTDDSDDDSDDGDDEEQDTL